MKEWWDSLIEPDARQWSVINLMSEEGDARDALIEAIKEANRQAMYEGIAVFIIAFILTGLVVKALKRNREQV